MVELQLLYSRRSDGKLEVRHKKHFEMNRPSAEQLDRRPDANGVCDYYREIGLDEAKHVDWRRKLAGMMVRELEVEDPPGRSRSVRFKLGR